ncbi:hypothetical protein TD95_002469 [Thielaviopsis punctulata]|uniref:Multiple myeloma tumor-associated protein 2-like N-terminal domain-containing protein n=1 Tax=Thielaviopsis punctulata TaxID=72032 RepID=A0A0F4Z978_9PEZI|nr:hypothetical protein TD95_002469 [Thielaviopsis punctulata]
MDLLSTIRKSGSRGGVNFNWDDVAKSSHRQNYLGHSLKAPVGRWQSGKDLHWYAKSADPESSSSATADVTARDAAEQQRRDELRRIKEAEEDAMARALGLPPPLRTSSGANAIAIAPRGESVAHVEQEKKDTHRSRRDRSRDRADSARDREHTRDRDDQKDRSERRRHRDDRHRKPHRDRSTSRAPRHRDSVRDGVRDHDSTRRRRSTSRERHRSSRTKHDRRRSRSPRD